MGYVWHAATEAAVSRMKVHETSNFADCDSIVGTSRRYILRTYRIYKPLGTRIMN